MARGDNDVAVGGHPSVVHQPSLAGRTITTRSGGSSSTLKASGLSHHFERNGTAAPNPRDPEKENLTDH